MSLFLWFARSHLSVEFLTMSHIVALGSDRMYWGRCLNQIFRVSTRSHLSVPREGRGLDVLIITISMSSRLYVQGVL